MEAVQIRDACEELFKEYASNVIRTDDSIKDGREIDLILDLQSTPTFNNIGIQKQSFITTKSESSQYAVTFNGDSRHLWIYLYPPKDGQDPSASPILDVMNNERRVSDKEQLQNMISAVMSYLQTAKPATKQYMNPVGTQADPFQYLWPASNESTGLASKFDQSAAGVGHAVNNFMVKFAIGVCILAVLLFIITNI